MTKYKHTQADLQTHWDEQLNFIESSAKLFDEGNESEAKRIATHLRVLFHNTNSSHSLIHQLNRTGSFPFWSSAGLYTPANLVSSWTLLSLVVNNQGLVYAPLATDVPQRTFFCTYEDWWNEIIFDDKKNVFSRKDIVFFVANQDGGAHVDPTLNAKYAELIKHNSLGWTDTNGNPANNNPAYNAIRQMAYELFVSQNYFNKGTYTRKKIKNRLFEMRFVDPTRRFKWSTTEITCSEETLAVVKQYRKENRTLYTQQFTDGTTFTFIG
ncbi:hypothetical protein [Bacillus mycoides]|uniref:hypothetical protein n=1 Tax=Bacillus mycoides TaxID=1405 RepID=UPI0036ECAFAC